MGFRTDQAIRSRCERLVGALVDGKYRLEALLGFGSAGAVYRAQNEWAGRTVALKLMHYEGPDEEALTRRFIREARASNRVLRDGRPHPNVANALDVGRDLSSGRLFIVQELLQGRTLAVHLADTPSARLSVQESVSLLLPILDAIGAAHAAGIVHRDLKPENIFLREEGDSLIPMVLDFGIAKVLDDRMTPNAEVMGTPQYMAPESFRGVGEVDQRADVWAIGVILYEVLSGRSPFASPTNHPVDSLRRILSVDPENLAASGHCSAPIWSVIRRALEKEPAARIASARELADGLVDALEPLRMLRVPPGVSPRELRDALYVGERGGVLRGAVRASVVPGEEFPDDDAPEVSLGEDPTRSWWNLVFQGPRFTADALIEILGLRELRNRAGLHVVDVPLGDLGVARLLAADAFRGVSALTLRGVGLGPDGLASLVENAQFHEVIHLDLEGNALGAKGVSTIVNSPRASSLRSLGLTRCGLVSGDLQSLLTSPLLSRLQRLELAQNELCDDDLLQVLGQPMLPASLWLGLARNRLSPQFSAWARRELGPRVRRLVL